MDVCFAQGETDSSGRTDDIVSNITGLTNNEKKYIEQELTTYLYRYVLTNDSNFNGLGQKYNYDERVFLDYLFSGESFYLHTLIKFPLKNTSDSFVMINGELLAPYILSCPRIRTLDQHFEFTFIYSRYTPKPYNLHIIYDNLYENETALELAYKKYPQFSIYFDAVKTLHNLNRTPDRKGFVLDFKDLKISESTPIEKERNRWWRKFFKRKKK